MRKKIAIYPGTFDPITLGHLDIIRRARRLCDHLIIASATHHSKKPLFTPQQRVNLIKSAISTQDSEDYCSCEVAFFDGLMVDFAVEKNANFIIRGLRTMTDFDYEFQIVGVNQQLNNQIDTIFLPADMQTQFISSSIAKQIFNFGGDLSPFLPQSVIHLMKQYLSEK